MVADLYRGERHLLSPDDINNLKTDPHRWIPRLLQNPDYVPAWWFHNGYSDARFYADENYGDEDDDEYEGDEEDDGSAYHPVIFHSQFSGPGRWREQNLGLHGGEGQHLKHGTPLQLHSVDVGGHHIPLSPPIPLQVANGFDKQRWDADPRHQRRPENPVLAALKAVQHADAIMTGRHPQ